MTLNIPAVVQRACRGTTSGAATAPGDTVPQAKSEIRPRTVPKTVPKDLQVSTTLDPTPPKLERENLNKTGEFPFVFARR